jgi:predicted DNA-binding transcriptional regulator AlpA
MSEPSKKIISLQPDAVPADKMIVSLTAGELRELIGEVVEQKLRRVSGPAASGLLTVDQASEILGYSKDWVYRNWRKVGGAKKISGRGLRFDAVELQNWIESRKTA